MSDPHNIELKRYRLRARLPQYVRFAAIAALAAAILVVVAGFYRESSKTAFRLKGEHAQLSTDVIAEVNGYERRESDGEFTKYYIKADHARTFSDNHQELQNVYLEVYAENGSGKDVMSSDTALYIPEADKKFTAYFKGNVNIETRQALKVKTNHIVYSNATETAEADEAIEFDRENVRGRSTGAVVNIVGKRVELLKDVEIETFDTPELARSGISYAKINAGSATFDESANNISLDTAVKVHLTSGPSSVGERTTEIRAGRANLNFVGQNTRTAELKTLELFNDVQINSTDKGSSPTRIDAGYALYNKDGDRFELKQGAHIVTQNDSKATDIRANEIVYERTGLKASLTGGSEIRQGSDELKGDKIFATLFRSGKVEEAILRGNASAVQTSPERTTKIEAPELNASFTEAGEISKANAIGQSSVEMVPQQAVGYTRVLTNAARGIGILFKGDGLVESMRTDGRTTIQLNAPTNDPGAANKRVTADAVKAVFHSNGKDLEKAEAVGNAVLYIEPLKAAPGNYRTTVEAPRFDCEFFPAGSNVKTCIAGKKAVATRVPTASSERRGVQKLTADQMIAHFTEQKNDIDMMEASGNAKFTELDRNAVASQFTFSSSDEIVRLRGGEPTVWDSRARAKANEIDWHTSANRSYLRGAVSTTFYSARQMRDSSPFGATDKPVFITAATAEFDHETENALFTGNVRGWQENNYVRGDRLLIDQKAGKFTADGDVHSALYAARIRGNNGSVVPTSASAGSMTYQRDARLLQYRTNVDIRQGSDRITAGSADVYLDEKNELAKTVAENNVVITQPGRRATGNWAQYVAADEVATLRGQPATIRDAENGSSENSEITFFLREKRVVAESRTAQNPTGRSRSVYKVKVPK